MDLRHMRQLLAIQEHGSFAKAAEALAMSQPSLSKSIARLEDELKVRLFDRGATGAELTAVGELLVERARRILGEARELMRDAELATSGDTGFIRLGASSILRERLMVPLAIMLAQRHPGLKVRFEFNDRGFLLPALAARELDIAFVPFADDLGQMGLVIEELGRTAALAVAAPGHPLFSRPAPVAPQDLLDWRIAAPGPPGGYPLMRIMGLDQPEAVNLAYTGNDYEPVFAIAQVSDLVVLTAEIAVRNWLEAGRLAVIPLDRRPELSLVAAMTRAAAFSPILSKVAGYARQVGLDG
ncbi:MAG: bacterial regulatory helix-turn-helix, lysR family protein [Caulobacteraceae bacterium]|nr:bacterial regulatory helix-turn-helix, lysR family protein [Caulobacteraceae bacterium]